MRKVVLALSLLTSSVLISDEVTPPRKKILILSSNGGNGHNAAAATLKTLLGEEYEIKVVYPIDQLKIWGSDSGEEVYNAMLRNGWIRSMNVIARHIAPKLFRTRKQQAEKIVARYVRRENPDLVLSLIPFINFPASEAARKKEIPYLLVTTDNDLRNWVHGLHRVSHPQFKVTIGSDLPCSRDLLRKRNLPDTLIETIGLPLRPEFHVTKNYSELAQEYGIPLDKPVVFILMGGAGGGSALEYTKAIGSSDLGAHLIVCTGKNQKLAKKLNRVKLHPSNSMTVMGFTDKIADLMSLADLIVTKPGPGTLNEAIAMRLPVLLDGTSPPLSWERANIALVKEYGIGEQIRDLDEAPLIIKKYLSDTHHKQQVSEAYSRLPPNLFHERIREVVHSMCPPYEEAALEKNPPIEKVSI